MGGVDAEGVGEVFGLEVVYAGGGLGRGCRGGDDQIQAWEEIFHVAIVSWRGR